MTHEKREVGQAFQPDPVMPCCGRSPTESLRQSKVSRSLRDLRSNVSAGSGDPRRTRTLTPFPSPAYGRGEYCRRLTISTIRT